MPYFVRRSQYTNRDWIGNGVRGIYPEIGTNARMSKLGKLGNAKWGNLGNPAAVDSPADRG